MIFIQITEQLQSLSNLLLLLNDDQYKKTNELLGNASIGAHTRHIIELLKCVTVGYNKGMVDYVNRIRNLSLEQDKDLAIQELNLLLECVKRDDRPMLLIAETEASNCIGTTYLREIVYNTEHTIHHLALIRVALRVMKMDVVAQDFGMAYSTIKYQTALQKNE